MPSVWHLRLKPDWTPEMRYPTLNLGHADAIVADRLRGLEPGCDNLAVWRGSGESIDFDELDAAVEAAKAELERIGADPSLTQDKEPFEGALAVSIYPFLSSVPVEVKDDPGFWRYLSLSRFWWFVEWRESGPIERGNVSTYVDGRRNTEHIPLRMYLRVKAVAEAGRPELAQELEKCTDFWRSHVIRVRTATAPNLAAAFAAMQHGDDRLKTEALRSFARRLNRLWTNAELSTYSTAEASALLEALRDE